jgi:hypothetical protein
VLRHVNRQVAEIDLSHRQSEVADHDAVRIDQYFGGGEMLPLMLQGFSRQPVINLVLPGSKRVTRVLASQSLEP